MMKITPGYTWFNGKKLTSAECDLYNRYTVRIEATNGQERQELLDLRHKFLVSCFPMERE